MYNENYKNSGDKPESSGPDITTIALILACIALLYKMFGG